MRAFFCMTIIPMLFLASCMSPMVQTAEIEPMAADIVQIHNAYVAGDTALSIESCSEFIAHANELVSILNTMIEMPRQALSEYAAVFIRTEIYVQADSALLPHQKNPILQNIEILKTFYTVE